jgi:hypothetical protein
MAAAASSVSKPKLSHETSQLGNSPALHCLVFLNSSCELEVPGHQESARSARGTRAGSEGLICAACAQVVVASVQQHCMAPLQAMNQLLKSQIQVPAAGFPGDPSEGAGR